MLLITDRLILQLQSTEEVLAQIEAMSPADRDQVSDAWLNRLRSNPVPGPWTHAFRVVDRASGATIGTCAFAGPPDVAHSVEISYAIDMDYQRKGLATEAAQALVDYAAGTGEISFAYAHTLPDNIASKRVLEKCGFVYVGELVHPEDGLVCRWERQV